MQHKTLRTMTKFNTTDLQTSLASEYVLLRRVKRKMLNELMQTFWDDVDNVPFEIVKDKDTNTTTIVLTITAENILLDPESPLVQEALKCEILAQELAVHTKYQYLNRRLEPINIPGKFTMEVR